MSKESIAIHCTADPSDKVIITALDAKEFNISIMEGSVISNAIIADTKAIERFIAWYKIQKLTNLLLEG